VSESVNVGCGMLGGSEYVINVSGQTYRFEMHRYCGPMPVYKNGNERPLAPRHKFWTAVTFWNQQGQRVENGHAIWSEPREENRMRHPREVKQCPCGEQMYRDAKESWQCWRCG
jgi:hypothetical protein